MSPALVVTATVLAGLVTVAGLAASAAGRRIGLLHVAGTVLLEAVLVLQAVIAVAALLRGDRPPDTATFAGYLAGVVLLPVAGVLWARSEPTRWAGTVLAVATATVAVMVWRLLQLWEATGG